MKTFKTILAALFLLSIASCSKADVATHNEIIEKSSCKTTTYKVHWDAQDNRVEVRQVNGFVIDNPSDKHNLDLNSFEPHQENPIAGFQIVDTEKIFVNLVDDYAYIVSIEMQDLTITDYTAGDNEMYVYTSGLPDYYSNDDTFLVTIVVANENY